jgi:hypothetical protein
MTYVSMLQIIIRNGGVDGIAAKRVADYYCKHKLVKYNAHDGYRIMHGALFDHDIILLAVDAASRGKIKS